MDQRPSDRELYQRLAATLVALAPENWKSAWIEADLLEDVGKASVFCMTAEGTTVQMDPGFEGFEVVDQTFVELRNLMRASGHPGWRKALFRVEPNGHFHTEFDYAG